MSPLIHLYLKGAMVGGISGGIVGTCWSNTRRMRNCTIGIAGGSAGVIALLAISTLSPIAGLFCRYATYGGLLGCVWGHKMMQANLTNSMRVGVVFGLFIAAMGWLLGPYAAYGSFIGLNLATMAYFSGCFEDTAAQRRLLIPLGL